MSRTEIDTEIRTALAGIRDAVEAPPVDRIALQARVRAERRRRTTGRVAAALVSAAAVTVTAVGVSAVVRETPPPTTDVAAGPLATPAAVTGFALDGRLVVGTSGGYEKLRTPARTVLGVLDGVLTFLDREGGLWGVPVDGSGTTGPVRRLLPGVIDYSWQGTGVLTVQTQDGLLHAWRGGDAPWESRQSPTTDHLAAVDGGVWVESDSSGLTLRSGGLRKRLPRGGGVTGTDLVGGTLAYETFRALRFYDARTGELLARLPGQWGGRLTPDGAAYVGVGERLSLVDPRSGDRQEFTGPEGLDSLVWTSEDTFVGRDHGGGEGRVHVLWECGVESLSCERLYADPAGTLELAK